MPLGFLPIVRVEAYHQPPSTSAREDEGLTLGLKELIDFGSCEPGNQLFGERVLFVSFTSS